ncbi:MAG: histidine phosphatase family protein [Flavobacteriales bacterium]|nr:histidine phosphatase family protein [Flavobacteriales bacterium]
MKRLYINRHAKSSWDDRTLTDFERPLNGRGLRDAPFMAEVFAQDHRVDQIISSPANRALSTAIEFAKALSIPLSDIKQDKTIYHASIVDLMKVVQSIDDQLDSVIMFGHNPGFSYIVDHLTGDGISMATCAIVGIDLHIDSWKAADRLTGSVVHYDYPKKHVLE